MARSEIDPILRRVDRLIIEINAFVPYNISVTEFRADLAGLLVVAMAASYEACVKETLILHASSHHALFGQFATNNYEKLSSKIQISDLYKYAKIFDPKISRKFKEKLEIKKNRIYKKTRSNIEEKYGKILDWRHNFAHDWQKNTTIEEAVATHKLAKRVIYAFNDAFQ